ncbi:MAG: HesA/MoeB/ThiF family protein [Casimicrobiaceae bacterium]|nr:HesA/MoeB/ThiF family protein [Casimicrobiaceae bacterium]MCX8099460.1 HesA/MoeB/ThiF family protein [Casimicrobiaceae bacterium]MDW8312511.1 HesA/MoeB/ThiF family protein [Burkholderiales bacterium]
MDDEALTRYSRHILLEEIGIEGQERLRLSRALVIGAGGLGSPVALYLASAGVGRITIADPDTVDLTNLQRQIAHDTASIGQAKVASAAARMRAINPTIEVRPLPERLEGERLAELVAEADVVIDCTDRLATRHAINRACVAARVPLVFGAAVRMDGQVSVFDPRRADSPCYACLFPEGAQYEEERCAVMGVFAPLVGIVGTIQAAEAIKLLAQAGEPLLGRLLLIDARRMDLQTVRIARTLGCAVCGTRV